MRRAPPAAVEKYMPSDDSASALSGFAFALRLLTRTGLNFVRRMVRGVSLTPLVPLMTLAKLWSCCALVVPFMYFFCQ